jgi:alkyl hydroperoxide reductase subunit AhpC
LFFIPDLKNTCIYNLLEYSAAYEDFKNSLDIQMLIISSDGAATEEDIKIPIIASTETAKDYGMEGANGVFILDHQHRLRNVQIGSLDRTPMQTVTYFLSLMKSDRDNVAIPNSWETFDNATISKHSLRMK